MVSSISSGFKGKRFAIYVAASGVVQIADRIHDGTWKLWGRVLKVEPDRGHVLSKGTWRVKADGESSRTLFNSARKNGWKHVGSVDPHEVSALLQNVESPDVREQLTCWYKSAVLEDAPKSMVG